MDLLIQLGIFLFLLALGFFVGSYRERSHERQLDAREESNGDFWIDQTRSFTSPIPPGDLPPKMIAAEAVIATDYLKSFLAGMRRLFGGEVRSYQTLLVRARREALQRMVEEAQREGYNALCNVRFESADVGGNSTMNKVATVAILASSTAYRRDVFV